MALEVRTVVTFEGGVITLDEVPRYRVPEMFYILFWADVQIHQAFKTYVLY